MSKDFLRDYQKDAVDKMRNGCILNGGVGSGKSRTGLYYYFKENGGSFANQNYVPMKNPQDLYIITTAMKRDSHEWDSELANYRISTDPEQNKLYPGQKIFITFVFGYDLDLNDKIICIVGTNDFCILPIVNVYLIAG